MVPLRSEMNVKVALFAVVPLFPNPRKKWHREKWFHFFLDLSEMVPLFPDTFCGIPFHCDSPVHLLATR